MLVKVPLVPKVGLPSSTKWSSFLGVKPTGKLSFPRVKVLRETEKGTYAISILDKLVDHSIKSMTLTLVGKFLGPRPNIDNVRSFIKKKCALKGQVSIMAMAKGFLSFYFSCMEDLSIILCEGPWAIGCSSLVL